MKPIGSVLLFLIASVTTFAQLAKKHDRFLQEYVVTTPYNRPSQDFIKSLTTNTKTTVVSNLPKDGALKVAGSFDPQLLPITDAAHVFFEVRQLESVHNIFFIPVPKAPTSKNILANYIVEYRFADTSFTPDGWTRFIRATLKAYKQHFQKVPVRFIDASELATAFFTNRDADIDSIKLEWPYDNIAKQFILRITIPFWWRS